MNGGYLRLRKILHLDGSHGGRERADLDFCVRLVRTSCPDFAWDLSRPFEIRMEHALMLPRSTPQERQIMLGVAFLEESRLESELRRLHPDLLDEGFLFQDSF